MLSLFFRNWKLISAGLLVVSILFAFKSIANYARELEQMKLELFVANEERDAALVSAQEAVRRAEAATESEKAARQRLNNRVQIIDRAEGQCLDEALPGDLLED